MSNFDTSCMNYDSLPTSFEYVMHHHMEFGFALGMDIIERFCMTLIYIMQQVSAKFMVLLDTRLPISQSGMNLSTKRLV